MFEYRNVPVRELATELENEAPMIVDKIVDSRSMNAVCTGPDGLVQIRVPGFDEADPGRDSMFPMNAWAHGQMSQITKIPKVYYDRLRSEEKGQLLADNINAWLPTEKRRLVKTMNGTIRAILSDKYKTIDNLNILTCTMKKLLEYREVGPKFQKCQIGPTRMYLKIMLEGLNGEVTPDDKYHYGLLVTNSEVGASSLKVEPYMLRQVCSNGMIRQTVLKKIHLGSVNTDIVASPATRLLQDRTLYSEFEDAIDTVLATGHFQDWLDSLKATKEVEILEPTDAVANLANKYNITEQDQKLIQDYFFKEEDTTQHGMIQGITRAAQELENTDEAVRWEGIAGDLSGMGEKEFQKHLKVKVTV